MSFYELSRSLSYVVRKKGKAGQDLHGQLLWLVVKQ